MNDVIARWARTAGATALLGMLVATGTGCGALAAAANPKVAWALKDPAPMSVVVRRADVAETTAQQVDRVMTDTPANDDSAWLAKVAPDKEEATATLAAVRQQPLYAPGSAGQGSRVVAAEVWARSLAQIEPKSASAASAPAPTAPAAPNSTDPADPVADASGPASEPAAPVGKTASPDIKKKNKKKGPGSLAKNDKSERINKKASKNAPVADPPTAKAPVDVPAPAPPTPTAAKYPSLLAAVDRDLGAAWSEVMDKKKTVGGLKTQIAALEAANDVTGVTAVDKKANQKTIDDLEKQVGAGEKEAAKLADAFIPKAKAAASKAAPEVRQRLGAALVNLRQAVDDAKTSNGAAAVRYPLAATTLVASTKAMAAVYTADIIEEKTGKRPSMAGFQPGVTLEGGKVAITLNGLSASDMGKLTISELTSEVALRTTRWVGHTAGLLGTIAATSDFLAFENDVLGALIDGFKAGGWTPPAPVTIPEAPVAGAPSAGTPRS